jgi:hypothetical protein
MNGGVYGLLLPTKKGLREARRRDAAFAVAFEIHCGHLG